MLVDFSSIQPTKTNRFAIINKTTNICDNIIMLDPKSDWSPPAEFYKVNIDNDANASINYKYDPKTKSWTNPNPVKSDSAAADAFMRRLELEAEKMKGMTP